MSDPNLSDKHRHPSSGPRRAITLWYDGIDVPQVAATGQGELARRVIEVALESGIPAIEDPMLAHPPAETDLGEHFPKALLRAVPEVLSYALFVNDCHEEVLRRAREKGEENDGCICPEALPIDSPSVLKSG